MSKRLDQERQSALEPKRMEFAKSQITKLGYTIEHETETQIQFMFMGKTVYFFPYSGWASGSTINSGRGLQKLLNQLKP